MVMAENKYKSMLQEGEWNTNQRSKGDSCTKCKTKETLQGEEGPEDWEEQQEIRMEKESAQRHHINLG